MKIIEIASAEIGTSEFPAGSNKVKYNTWFYGKEVQDDPIKKLFYPWCGAFVSWVFNESGLNLGVIDYKRGFAGCQFAVRNLKKWGKLVTQPKPGDVIFFDWQGDGIFDHTGIFKRDVGNGLFDSIEGNTSMANDSNGGSVMLRQRKYKNAIFVRPFVLEK